MNSDTEKTGRFMYVSCPACAKHGIKFSCGICAGFGQLLVSLDDNKGAK